MNFQNFWFIFLLKNCMHQIYSLVDQVCSLMDRVHEPMVHRAHSLIKCEPSKSWSTARIKTTERVRDVLIVAIEIETDG
jgi:hypothetical protein